MSSKVQEPKTVTRWWQYSALYRIFLQALIWLMLVIGLVFLIGSISDFRRVVTEETWSHFAGGSLCLMFAFAYSRYQLLAISFTQRELLVRRIFPGWIEHIPWKRIRRSWAIYDLFSHHLFFFLPRRLPVQINTNRWGPKIKDWEGLLTAMRSHLDQEGKWRE